MSMLSVVRIRRAKLQRFGAKGRSAFSRSLFGLNKAELPWGPALGRPLGENGAAKTSGRSEKAVVANFVESRPGQQGEELGDEVEGTVLDVCASVGIGAFEPVA
jgi:hypothetical protein